MTQIFNTRRARMLAGSITGVVLLLGATACGSPPSSSSPCSTPTAINSGYPGFFSTAWWAANTRTSGSSSVDSTAGGAPGFNCNALHLQTGASTQNSSGVYQDKAEALNYGLYGTALSSIHHIGYWAYRDSSTQSAAVDISFNVEITDSGNFLGTLTYEPYNQSGGQGAIVSNTWQHWDATATTPGDGVWWTSRIASPAPGSQSNPQPWAFFQSLYPTALVAGYGLDVGSGAPHSNVYGDGLNFGGTVTDF